MSETLISIAPARPEDVPAGARPVNVELVYRRRAPAASSDGDLGDLPETIFETARIVLDAQFRGSAELEDVADSSQVELRFLSGSGATRLAKSVEANGDDLQVALDADELKALLAAEPQPEEAPATVERAVRFVAVSDRPVPYAHSTLQVAPLPLGDDGWRRYGLDTLLHIAEPATAAVEAVAEQVPALAALDWAPVHVGVDGGFRVRLPADTKAWLWWLSGPANAVGAVLDDVSVPRTAPLTVALPPFQLPQDGDQPNAFVAGRLRADVSETELANNPEIYTEDPGQYCKPFENPERILGERSFHVVLRAEQPEISPQASLGTRHLATFDYEPVAELTNAAGNPSSGTSTRRTRRGNGNGGGSSLAGRVLDVAALGTRLVRHTLPSAYVDILQHTDSGRATLDARHPLQWEGSSSRYQATTVARGHIVELRLRWRSNGYSLGTVSKTLTLAPRQVKRIQKIDWQRTERTRREERTRLVDETADQVVRERDYEDAVEANLSEWARGESESSTTAGAGGFGFALTGFVIGGGGGHSNASSSSSQEGGRRTSASEEQRLRDAVRRFAEGRRQLESVVVTEVTQEEEVTGTTEIVRNANYAHSLTVIYYQILRHLRIETAFAGVRECLFVPFAINPFTVARAYRWRDLLRRGLRDRRFAPALDHLRDVLTHFTDSDVPPNRRSDQPLRTLYGSLTLTLGVERPRDTDEEEFDEAAWAVLGSFLGTPARAIYEQLRERVKADRDRAFQEQHAPRIATSWVDTLQLRAGSQPLDADFTLATRYTFNGTVRVDFTVALADGQQVTREDLAQLRVTATKDLTPGSVANLTGLRFTYETDHYRRSVQLGQGAKDLVTVETGARDSQGALFSAVPDAWERRNVRAEITRAVLDLVEHLNDHVEYYHKVIWWNMDRDRLFMLVDGCYVPGTNGVSVASVVERDPIAIIGNCLVFRVSSGSFLGIDGIETPEQLYNYYATHQLPREPMYLSLPTDGLYAQTVMDECGALEEHYGNIDWVLSDTEPELGTLAPELLTSRRAEPEQTTPTPFPQSIINLQNAPEAPAPAGLAGVLGAVTNPNAFRDMAGLAGTQANARAGLETAASLASTFGQQAAALKLAELLAKQQATQAADQKLASIKRALDKQLVTPEQAQMQAAKVLEEMQNPSTLARPHQDPTLAAAVRGLIGVPGGEVEAATADGYLKASLASTAGPLVAQAAGGAAAPAPAPAAPPSRIDGIDCHGPNAIPSWQDLEADGIKFAILKATEGRTFHDRQYRNRHDSARSEQFIVGSYHYARASGPAANAAALYEDEADNMVGLVQRLLPGDLPPVLDFEENHNTNAVTWNAAVWQGAVQAFLDRVETALGRVPMIYTSQRVWDANIGNPAGSSFGDYPLWVVRWFGAGGNPSNRYLHRMTRNPPLPAPWDDWAIWQYSGSQPGVDSTPPQYANLYAVNPHMDVDMSNGGIHVLRGLAGLGRPALGGSGIEYIAYADEDGVIRALINVGFWLELNVSAYAGSSPPGPAAAGDVAACEVGSSQFYAFRERADGHLYEIEQANGAFTLTDLTAAAGGTATAGTPAGDPVYLVSGTDRFLVYRGDDDHQYLLERTGGAWQATDVTSAAGLADASGDAALFVANGDLHLVARAGLDGHLVQAVRTGGTWQHSDLTAAATAPAATYQPTTYTGSDGDIRIVYRALHGEIHQLDPGPADVNLSQLAGGAPVCVGSPAAFVLGGNPHVVYRRTDGALHEIFWNGTAWGHGPLPCTEHAAADPAVLVTSAGGTSTAYAAFRGRDGTFREVTFDGTTWTCAPVEPAPEPQLAPQHVEGDGDDGVVFV